MRIQGGLHGSNHRIYQSNKWLLPYDQPNVYAESMVATKKDFATLGGLGTLDVVVLDFGKRVRMSAMSALSAWFLNNKFPTQDFSVVQDEAEHIDCCVIKACYKGKLEIFRYI